MIENIKVQDKEEERAAERKDREAVGEKEGAREHIDNITIMSRKRPRQSIPSHVEFEMDTSDDNCDELVAIPNPDNSGCSSDSDSDFESIDHLSSITYKQASENYTDNQCKLEGDHQYKWMVGEKSYPNETEDKLLLTDGVKKSIQKSEPIQLFEKFFCMEMKTYIIDSCKENGFELQLDDLNTFIGIIIVSSFNKRKSQRDYWSTDPFLLCEVVSSAMQRDTFEKIKSELKYLMPKDNDPSDKAWRVRKLLQLFQRNIRQFGLWKTALSVDEMMAKSYARTSLKQFIRGKPIRFGLKFWGLCTADGYLLNLDLYCGKTSSIGDKLGKCALGSRVVMELLDPFLKSIPPKKISQFHLYCDNFFTNFDLLVHLKKLGLQCTGTIRENRVKEKNVIDKKSPR
ncbi:piggyBac transposable element-derived protein 3-like, partial [Chelonus insularis]|uniref:piggyBac transposable element-derived protein 3-like n=1 Tax=Chelonus insularis TaxID=460826 RepID=UPI0015895280